MHSVKGRWFSYLLLLLMSVPVLAQRVEVRGGFVEDSLQIGQDITYWLCAQYPQSLEIALPDTTYNFSPFEFSDKQYFPSRTAGQFIVDSAVYTLQSYEIDAVQYLALPALLLSPGGDTTIIQGKMDSIFFQELALSVSDSTSLKTNVKLQPVHEAFNTWLYIGILIVLGVLGLALFFIFGGKVQKALRIRRLRKQYAAYSERLTQQIKELRASPSQHLAERAITDWKHFLEELEKKPYSKLTTKEIMQMEYTGELNENLKNIDRNVYGGHIHPDIFKDFQAIEDYTQHRYTVVTDQIRNNA